MSSSGADPATSIVTATAWTGVAAYGFWMFWSGLTLWFAVPLGLMVALTAGGYAIESLSQEMTVRRWAISQVVFTVFGVVFLIAGFTGGLGLATWLCFAGAFVFLAAAVLCAVAAKELF